MTAPVDVDVLYREFPGVAIKERTVGGGRKLSYVEGHSVIHRLNEATGNRWDLSVRAIDTMQIGTQTVVRAHVALTLPGLGTREHIGVQAVADRSGEDLVKGAVTDALKKAATLFGVGLHLYGPDYEAGEGPRPEAPTPGPQAAAAVKAGVQSVVKRMPTGQTSAESKMVQAVKEMGAKRGLSAEQVEGVARRVFDRDVREMSVEEGRQLWNFLAGASADDMSQALGVAS